MDFANAPDTIQSFKTDTLNHTRVVRNKDVTRFAIPGITQSKGLNLLLPVPFAIDALANPTPFSNI